MADNIQNSSLWLGVPNLSKDQLKNFDPAYTGYVHIFVVRVPEVLVKHDTVFGTNHGKNFKAIFERTSTSFSGIPELTVNYVDQVHGFADRKVPHATTIESNFDTFTVRCLEFKKLPVYNMLQEWMYLVGGDESSKIKDYKGMAADIAGGYSLENHTAAFLVCNSNPELTEIQGRAHYITAAMPTTLPREIFHQNAGEIGIVEGHDIAMKGVLKWGSEINTKALEYLTERKTVINYYAASAVRGGKPTTNPFHPGGTLNGETIAAQTSMM
jgi:hypothetical protein